jgi:uncharacterized protein YcfJ
MRRLILVAGVAAAILTPTLASAYDGCEARAHDRRVAGTVLGGIAGAVIGNQVSHGGGTIIGGIGGAVIGNQLSKTHCPHYAYYRDRRYEPAAYRYGPARCGWENRSFYGAHGELIHQQVQVCR